MRYPGRNYVLDNHVTDPIFSRQAHVFERMRDDSMKIVIIVPTYNERENIGRLIGALQQQFQGVPAHDMIILLVDDHSPDGTEEIVRQEMERYDIVHLLTGEKSGLGAAYILGMEYALSALQADAVFEMDADFSHKPEDVPRMIAALDEGNDFVIGSRYVRGGMIPGEWGLLRRMNSLFGNLVARYLAGLYRIRDCTAPFRAIRSSTLRKTDLRRLKVQGYAFQVALLHAAVTNGAIVKEIPVQSIDRTQGESKLELSDIIEFILNAWWIRLQSLKTFIQFCVVGTSGVVINLGCFTMLLWFGLNKYIASPVTIDISILWNFLLNDYWTFRRKNAREKKGIKALKFNAVSSLALAVSYTTFALLTSVFPEAKPQVHHFVGIISATFVNYFCNVYWTFRDRV
jgi:dolichol-phosphate mannosyltransferase